MTYTVSSGTLNSSIPYIAIGSLSVSNIRRIDDSVDRDVSDCRCHNGVSKSQII